MSRIEWTGETWNPIVGCSIVSPGCTNCYAMRMAARMEAMGDAAVKAGRTVPGPHYAGTTKWVNGKPVWTGKVALAPDKILTSPLKRRTPTTYFVNSMSDLFHEDVPDAWIMKVFVIMAATPWHTYQVLTKRSDRMRKWVGRGECGGHLNAMVRANALRSDAYSGPLVEAILTGTGSITWPLPNVWLGVSAEDQRRADERIPDLLATPCAVRFVSAEPLLGPIDFRSVWTHCPTHDYTGGFCVGPCPDRRRLDWVIVGGESGPGARPMHPDWARATRDQCEHAKVAFFFKQWGEWVPVRSDPFGGHDSGKVYWPADCVDPGDDARPLPGTLQTEWVLPSAHHNGHLVARVGKARAGRLLDGRTWDEMPGRADTYVGDLVL